MPRRGSDYGNNNDLTERRVLFKEQQEISEEDVDSVQHFDLETVIDDNQHEITGQRLLMDTERALLKIDDYDF